MHTPTSQLQKSKRNSLYYSKNIFFLLPSYELSDDDWQWMVSSKILNNIIVYIRHEKMNYLFQTKTIRASPTNFYYYYCYYYYYTKHTIYTHIHMMLLHTIMLNIVLFRKENGKQRKMKTMNLVSRLLLQRWWKNALKTLMNHCMRT